MLPYPYRATFWLLSEAHMWGAGEKNGKFLGGASKAYEAAYDPTPPTPGGQLLLCQALYCDYLWSIFYQLWLEV